ncbi:MAG: U32 family peptidase [Ruminococcus sp.]|nr:U32 family peptidase [Ruminococcus sp.]
MKRPELLAPAGSMETLTAALRSGADAVYAGGKLFSARSSAANFTDEELEEAVRLCHTYGAKIYLAVNTVISDSEADTFRDFIVMTSKLGCDGYIVQDWGAADIIRSAVPDAVIHASTQMSVHTAAGARLLRSLGYARVVPARELDRKAIERISTEDIEVEVFVHGALCMSVSGQCYMSAMMGSRSANRGCCGQACRLPFSAAEKKDCTALSLKDLSLLPVISELEAAGADSLKIEGRMKRPEYVASAVHELGKALDGEKPDMKLLKGIFSRSGFTDGYFTGERRDMFGRREKEDVTSARELIPQIHELYRSPRQVYTMDARCTLRAGEPVRAEAVCRELPEAIVSAEGNVPQAAQNRPVSEEDIAKQLSKLGGTVFSAGTVSAEIGEGLFIPAGALNELRRNLADRLAEAVVRENTPVYDIRGRLPELPAVTAKNVPERLPLRVLCRNAAQARAALTYKDTEYIIVSPELVPELGDIPKERIILSPPRFITDEKKLTERLRELREEGYERLFCHTPDTVGIGRELGYRLHGSFTLNVFNSYSAEYLRGLGLEDCLFSIEAELTQFAEVRTSLPLGAVIAGRLPLMLTRNCPIRNEVGCSGCTGHLTDRTGRKLPVACSREYVEILNSDVLFMADRLREFSNIGFGCVLLCDESPEQALALISGTKPDAAVTRGLYYRGVRR